MVCWLSAGRRDRRVDILMIPVNAFASVGLRNEIECYHGCEPFSRVIQYFPDI